MVSIVKKVTLSEFTEWFGYTELTNQYSPETIGYLLNVSGQPWWCPFTDLVSLGYILREVK